MKKVISLSLSISMALCFLNYNAMADNIQGKNKSIVTPLYSPIITGAPILSIVPDARGAALAGIGVSTSSDAAAAFYNPAKLVFAEKAAGMMFSYTPWMSSVTNDVGLSYLSGYWQAMPESSWKHTFAASLRYFSMGEVNVFGRSGMMSTSTRPYEFALDLSYAAGIGSHWSLGGTLRYIRSDIAGSSSEYLKAANSMGFDLGVFYQKHFSEERISSLNIGGSLLNLGPKLNYGEREKSLFQPAMMRLGASYQMNIDPSQKFVLGYHISVQRLLVPAFQIYRNEEAAQESAKTYYDTNAFSGIFKSFNDAGSFSEEMKDFVPSVAVELAYNQMAYARLGYCYQAAERGSAGGLSAGVGFSYAYFKMDFSYFAATEARNPLNNTLRLSLSAYF